MSSKWKNRILTFALLIAVSGSTVFAAPKQSSRNGDLFSRIGQIVKSIGKKLLPTVLDDITWPRP